MSWEVAKMCEICKNSWIKPTVYQRIYALQRSIEAELFPCLRHYDISLYAFQPLAGGFLTSRYTSEQETFEPGSRFDPKHITGVFSRRRYWNDAYFDALDLVSPVVEKHGLTLAEVALGWIEHHSKMKTESGDAIIIEASGMKHLQDNLVNFEKEPLPEDVLEVLEKAWLITKGVSAAYYH